MRLAFGVDVLPAPCFDPTSASLETVADHLCLLEEARQDALELLSLTSGDSSGESAVAGPFPVGSFVFMKRPLRAKLEERYLGPFVVVDRAQPFRAVVGDADGARRCLHLSQLKAFTAPASTTTLASFDGYVEDFPSSGEPNVGSDVDVAGVYVPPEIAELFEGSISDDGDALSWSSIDDVPDPVPNIRPMRTAARVARGAIRDAYLAEES